MNMLISDVSADFDLLISEATILISKVSREQLFHDRVSERISELLKKLKSLFNQSGLILPSYLQKKYKEKINKIEEELNYPCIAPKFTIFGDHHNDIYGARLKNSNGKTEIKQNDDLLCKGFTEYSKMDNEIICIDHCIDSDIVIHGDCQTLRINFVYSSRILVTGRVLHEVSISNCENVTLVTHCQQLRLNAVSFSLFLIETSSTNGAVLEDSHHCSFGIYPHSPQKTINIIDFSSVHVDKAVSPNFNYLPSTEIPNNVRIDECKIVFDYSP